MVKCAHFSKPLMLALLILSLLILSSTGCGIAKGESRRATGSSIYDSDPPGTGASHLPSPIICVVLVTSGRAIFDNLLWKDSQGYIPALASWEFLKKKTPICLSCRDRATWHDGTPFGKDVVFSVDYLREHNYEWVNLDVVQKRGC